MGSSPIPASGDNMGSNLAKSQQLGMPFGTAQHRLKKMVMFDLVKRLELNFCFRCGNPINSVDEFSIEHKKPWQGIDADLFWDLENIAFSHLSCNSSATDHRKTFTAQMKRCPEGTSWCNKCKTFRPKSEFSKNKSRICGLQNRCNSCIRYSRVA